jgi:hypothetical protein
MRAYQVFERGLIAVLGTPELRDLLHAALQARTLRFSVLCDQLGFEFLHGLLRLGKCRYRQHGHQRGGRKDS